MQVTDFIVNRTYIVRMQDIVIPDSGGTMNGGQRIILILGVSDKLLIKDTDRKEYFLDPNHITNAHLLSKI